jgi:hypothetical protein
MTLLGALLGDKAAEYWCRVMHKNTTWPRNGTYRCRDCQRIYPIPWSVQNRRLGFENVVNGFEKILLQLGLTARVRRKLSTYQVALRHTRAALHGLGQVGHDH